MPKKRGCLTNASENSSEVYCLTRRITQVKVPHVMSSLDPTRTSFALTSAGAGVCVESVGSALAIESSGSLGRISNKVALGLVRLSLLIAVLLGLITAGCGPPN